MEEEASSTVACRQHSWTLGFQVLLSLKGFKLNISLMMFLSTSSRMASLSILAAEAECDPSPVHVSSSITLYCHIYKQNLEQGPGLKPFLPRQISFQKVLKLSSSLAYSFFFFCISIYSSLFLLSLPLYPPSISAVVTVLLGTSGVQSDSFWLNSWVEATTHTVSNFCSNQFPDFLAQPHYQAVLIFSTITVKNSQ